MPIKKIGVRRFSVNDVEIKRIGIRRSGSPKESSFTY
jgi:hypothetical protein